MGTGTLIKAPTAIKAVKKLHKINERIFNSILLSNLLTRIILVLENTIVNHKKYLVNED